jgi:hypothetical protein
MSLRLTNYEIESIKIICKSVNPLNEQPFYVWAYTTITPTVKIKFKTGEEIETYLHKLDCTNHVFRSILSSSGTYQSITEKCSGKLDFTGNLSEDGWESMCHTCGALAYGPIYIDTEKQRKPNDKV